jgi:hypothetical protein
MLFDLLNICRPKNKPFNIIPVGKYRQLFEDKCSAAEMHLL